jgi:hypothetical protein
MYFIGYLNFPPKVSELIRLGNALLVCLAGIGFRKIRQKCNRSRANNTINLYRIYEKNVITVVINGSKVTKLHFKVTLSSKRCSKEQEKK